MTALFLSISLSSLSLFLLGILWFLSPLKAMMLVSNGNDKASFVQWHHLLLPYACVSLSLDPISLPCFLFPLFSLSINYYPTTLVLAYPIPPSLHHTTNTNERRQTLFSLSTHTCAYTQPSFTHTTTLISPALIPSID